MPRQISKLIAKSHDADRYYIAYLPVAVLVETGSEGEIVGIGAPHIVGYDDMPMVEGTVWDSRQGMHIEIEDPTISDMVWAYLEQLIGHEPLKDPYVIAEIEEQGFHHD